MDENLSRCLFDTITKKMNGTPTITTIDGTILSNVLRRASISRTLRQHLDNNKKIQLLFQNNPIKFSQSPGLVFFFYNKRKNTKKKIGKNWRKFKSDAKKSDTKTLTAALLRRVCSKTTDRCISTDVNKSFFLKQIIFQVFFFEFKSP